MPQGTEDGTEQRTIRRKKDLRRSLQNESGQHDQQDDHAARHTHIQDLRKDSSHCPHLLMESMTF